MYAKDFLFAGELASSHGLMICSFDGNNDNSDIANGADIEFTTVKASTDDVHRHINGAYGEVLSTTFSIAKMNCRNTSDIYFSVAEQRDINRWLNRKDGFYPFKLVQTDYDTITFNVRINVKKKEINGMVAGFILEITSDKPYAYYKEQKITFTANSNNYQRMVFDVSDDVGRTDIVMKVTTSSACNLSITNLTMNETLTIKNCSAGETITIDTQNQRILSTVRTTPELLKNFNFVWLNICNTRTDKRNMLKFSHPCSVELTYNPACKISF